jgi:hypothetical protein
MSTKHIRIRLILSRMPSSAPLKENLPTVRVNLCSHILDSRRLRLLLATFVRSEIISTDRCTESALRNLCMCWRVRVSQLFIIFFFLYLTPTTVSSLLLMHGHKGPRSLSVWSSISAPLHGLRGSFRRPRSRPLLLVPVSHLIR